MDYNYVRKQNRKNQVYRSVEKGNLDTIIADYYLKYLACLKGSRMIQRILNDRGLDPQFSVARLLSQMADEFYFKALATCCSDEELLEERLKVIDIKQTYKKYMREVYCGKKTAKKIQDGSVHKDG